MTTSKQQQILPESKKKSPILFERIMVTNEVQDSTSLNGSTKTNLIQIRKLMIPDSDLKKKRATTWVDAD